MQQILLAVLMAIVSLYQNPKVQSDPAMLAQVNQMFASITPLMQQASESTPTNSITLNVPTSTDNSQPIVINVTPPPAPIQQTPAPVLGAAPEVVSMPESCTLTVKPIDIGGKDTNPYTSRDGDYSWTSVGVPTSTTGQIYVVLPADKNNPQIDHIIGRPITGSQGETKVLYDGYAPFQQTTNLFRLNLDKGVCTTSWMGVNPDGSQFIPQN